MTLSGPNLGTRETLSSIQVAAAAPPRARRFGLGTVVSWVVFVLAMLYFFLPLIATFDFAMKAKPEWAAFTNTFKDAKFFGTLAYSFVIGLITIVVSTLIIVPTAYWVRLRVPRLRPVVEFVTLMPFVIPPIVMVFGPGQPHPADRGVHDPLVPVHVPRGRQRPADGRREVAHRGRP